MTTARAVHLDLRGLEPPQPMVKTLEAAGQLGRDEELFVITDRQPIHLLPLLAERGFRISTRRLADGHETCIWRA
jgi:TusA-related sulfurtransferase